MNKKVWKKSKKSCKKRKKKLTDALCKNNINNIAEELVSS